ncbi:glycosyltransferase family 2 protein [Methylobacterium sp. J-030]|uniref:glycosyltransferase family 2 protein n=1 Tax=Methylobacterium sp. J-030 TaxID=2836627 RepID=UPI001FBB25BD|nr:glycosyltransferase family 2 protein [Methylobacterium sp. J-030]
MLPIWLKHYTRQVGYGNCYVIDHGSTDGSTHKIEAQILRLPRFPIDENTRAGSTDKFCSALLFAYERVLFTDVDEIVVADPGRAANLIDYAKAHSKDLPSIVNVFGVDVLHDRRREGVVDWDRPITLQRKLIRPFSALCKPTFISEQAQWHAGFHFSDKAPSAFIADLFLFHLAFCDSQFLMHRQASRNIFAKSKLIYDHHAIPPEQLLAHVQAYVESLPRTNVRLAPANPQFERVKTEFTDHINEKKLVQLQEIWEIPRQFRGLF